MITMYGSTEFRAVARTSPGRTRLSIMHSLNRGRTHEWNLKTKKQKHTGECCSHTNTNFATDIRFAGNLNTEQLIRQWIVSDENIAKLGWYYASSVIAAVFRPDNVREHCRCQNVASISSNTDGKKKTGSPTFYHVPFEGERLDCAKAF